jgi:hypothetical protein
MRNPYEYILRESASSVTFHSTKTPPHSGLPDEKIIACHRGDELIAEIWPERDMKGKIDGYTVYPPAEYDERGQVRAQRTNPAPFAEKLFSVGRLHPTAAAALAAAKKFVKELK